MGRSLHKFNRMRHFILQRLRNSFLRGNQITKIQIHLNNVCNSRCTTCYIWKNKNAQQVPRETILRFVDQAFKVSKERTITLTGGEPLLRADVFDIIRSIHDKGRYTKLLTNGLLLNEDTIHRLHESRLDILNISLNAVDPQLHDASRGIRGNHGRIDAAVKHILKEKIPIEVNFVAILSKQNIDQVVPLMEYADTMETGIFFQPLRHIFNWPAHMQWGEMESNFKKMLPSAEEARKAMEEIRAYKKKGYRVYMPDSYLNRYEQYFENPAALAKSRLSPSLILTHQGDVQLSHQLPAIGNVSRNTLREMLDGKDAREQLKEGMIDKLCLCDSEPNISDFFSLGKNAVVRAILK